MGTVGLASYQFSYNHPGFIPQLAGTAGIALPPGGDVAATASVGNATGRPVSVSLMRLGGTGAAAPSSEFGQGQIEVLQREVVGLRRRLSALSEQNVTYSRRIAALEQQVAFSRLSNTASTSAASDEAVEPSLGVVVTKPAPDLPLLSTKDTPPLKSPEPRTAAQSRDTPPPKPRLTRGPNTDPATSQEQSRPAPRQISLYRGNAALQTVPAGSIDPDEPVRIVQRPAPGTPPVKLPSTSEEPVSTGSIPTLSAANTPEQFDATPTQTTLRPKIITPSGPSGRLRGGGDVHLKRSDFGAIIGRYRTEAVAAKAWADFKTQNSERMRDLRPLLIDSQADGGGVALMVGPFANAADAAIACVHLLDVAELCHPTIFAGDPLVTAATFRESAF